MTSDWYTSAGIAYADTHWSMAVVLSNNDHTAASQAVMDIETGRMIYGVRSATSDTAFVYDSFWAFWSPGGGAVGAVSDVVTMDAAVKKVYRAGALLDTIGGGATPVNVGGTFAVGANYVYSGSFLLDCHVHRLPLIKRVRTAVDLAKWAAWSVWKAGV
jgi:hypothetical protein